MVANDAYTLFKNEINPGAQSCYAGAVERTAFIFIGKEIRLFVGIGPAAGAAVFEGRAIDAFLYIETSRALRPIEAFMA